MEAKPQRKPDRDRSSLRRWIELAVALALLAIGALAIIAAALNIAQSGTSAGLYVELIGGSATAAIGLWRLVHSAGTSSRAGFGYKSFVAWRYLLVSPRRVTARTRYALVVLGAALLGLYGLQSGGVVSAERSLRNPVMVLGVVLLGLLAVAMVGGVLRYSKPSLFTCIFGIVVLVLSLLGWKIVGLGKLPFLHLDTDTLDAVLKVSNGTAIAGGVLIGLAMFFGSLRAFFTFFTTVPIGGVWIGTAALVIVLSVMSGFESDLREKILGSNAHIQITREEGNFVEWRDVKARIDRMPGVIASAPFAVSEVVVAANNTGMPVIIKGIDPASIGKVSDLVSDLEDRDAMNRLDPLVEDTHDLRVQPRARPAKPAGGEIVDPSPPDLPAPGEPIDFSGGEPAHTSGGGAKTARGSASGQVEPPPPFGGDAAKLLGDLDGPAPGRLAPDKPDKPAPARSDDPPAPARSDDRPATARSDDRPATARSDDTPAPGKSDDKPAADKPAADKPAADKPAADKLAVNKAAADKPAADTPPGKDIVDPAPPDLIRPDEPPADYSRPDYLPETVVKVVDIPFDAPSLSRRTQSLPGILVGRELVKQTHLYVGEEVRVVSPLSDPANPDATGTPIPFNRDYRVAGVFYTGMYEYDLKYVYVTLGSLQHFLDRGDAIDGLEVRLARPDETDVFLADFQAAFGTQYRVQDWKELNRSLFSALKLEKIAMFLVLGIVILVASFSIVGDLIMVVVEKARQIALLKTLGASDFGVMQLFAIQGLMIGVIGTLLGVGTGLLACWAGKQFGLPLNPDVYYIDKLPIHIEWTSVIASASAGVLISIAATLYPAMVAARVRPAAGMRH